MNVSRDKCTIALIVASVIVLTVRFRLVVLGEISLDLGPLSLANLELSEILPVIIGVALLAGLLICHVSHQWPLLAERFRRGYRESPRFVEAVRTAVANAAETDRYGSPYGGLNGSFRRRRFELGQFVTPRETLSGPVVVSPDPNTHWRAVFSGVLMALHWKVFAPFYAPLLLSLWALISIVA